MVLECSQEVGASHDCMPAIADSQSYQDNAASSSSYTAASLLLALTEHINSDQQREQRKQPCRQVDKIVVLHAYHPLSYCRKRSAQPCKSS